jgi:hypothetical protein
MKIKKQKNKTNKTIYEETLEQIETWTESETEIETKTELEKKTKKELEKKTKKELEIKTKTETEIETKTETEIDFDIETNKGINNQKIINTPKISKFRKKSECEVFMDYIEKFDEEKNIWQTKYLTIFYENKYLCIYEKKPSKILN